MKFLLVRTAEMGKEIVMHINLDERDISCKVY